MLLAVSMLLSVPVSLFVPPIAARFSSQAPMVLALGVLSFAGIFGMLVAPSAAPGLWVVLIGFGMGMFPLALLVMSLRTKSTSDTARLSAMAQSLGYLIAATGPFAFGVLREATGSWTTSLVLQLVLLAALTALGMIAGRPRYI
jgi:CP family cyanate transporter-like MFS transporter